MSRRDSNLDFLQDTIQGGSPELRSLHLEKLVGRGSFGRVYKGELLCPSRLLLSRGKQVSCWGTQSERDWTASFGLQIHATRCATWMIPYVAKALWQPSYTSFEPRISLICIQGEG